MNYVATDKQTMIDLNIQDGVYGERVLGSIYQNTDTKKGKRLMMHWIANPLSDIELICKRQEAIAWGHLPELPLNEEELDFLEYYLDYRERLSPKGAFLSFINKVDRIFKPESSRYVITRGVALVVKLFVRLYDFRIHLPENSPVLIKEFAGMVGASLSCSDLKKVLEEHADGKAMSDYTIDRYDYLFRQERLDIIRGLLDIVYQWDVLRTAHWLAVERNYCCRPIMTKEMRLSVSGFLHPFLQEGQKNDWSMSKGNVAIFTGSNMAGKSTTLKALASIIWLAHCGLPVPVESMICPVYEGLYTSINLPDSLRDGRSHFLAEVLRIKEVLLQARSGKRCLVVLDEMFRGTNAQDAFEASVAVNGLLIKYTSCHFLISTHIVEYARYFEQNPSCSFFYMESRIAGDHFICSHRLRTGISESRVGYWLVKKELGCSPDVYDFSANCNDIQQRNRQE
ncbi:MutS-related protein [Bacteroides helcogenes]|uniref:DNA mismatch repair protein MutS domain protein n=1 Tax=Bacteroides helcogenes (strain ATCC 35417 / DSM 20613 / JCM 6297 / CCUG 15421 / P 36-108) TaxID=693979 RepID=E6SVP2_BACT6|nr:DNA mismatch repair protein MutS domain protein [Bacteroides helcogenes]ADV43503.1 DNA mismatch repair protein MutS domain protein [Bacteroides helcogenes P 36-108]MDY5239229.1 DNA mismatch repair protein MutS [Bacteroides helcogenes]